MPITQAELKPLRTKLEALQIHLASKELAAGNLAALKRQVLAIDLGNGTKLSEAEWEYLNVKDFISVDRVESSADATTTVKNRITRALGKIDLLNKLTDEKLMRIEFADLFGAETSIEDISQYAFVAGIISVHILHKHFLSLKDFADVVAQNKDKRLTRYCAVSNELASEDFEKLKTFADVLEVHRLAKEKNTSYEDVIELITKPGQGSVAAQIGINIVLVNLGQDKIVHLFNVQAKGKNDTAARNAFITALKADDHEQGGIGNILSAEAKASEISQAISQQQRQFDEAAGKLFDAMAKVAKKGENGNFVKNSLDLNVSFYEQFKAFIYAIIKCGLIIPAVLELLGIGEQYLKSTRALKHEASAERASFEKLVCNRNASNKLLQEDLVI